MKMTITDSGRENAAAAAAADGGARDDNTLENDLYCDHATQTVLTIPKHIDLTKLLGKLQEFSDLSPYIKRFFFPSN